jgi:hypothetical protein
MIRYHKFPHVYSTVQYTVQLKALTLLLTGILTRKLGKVNVIPIYLTLTLFIYRYLFNVNVIYLVHSLGLN